MTNTKKTKIIAHRGASGIAPENTLASIRSALDCQADFIEIDVRLTKDEKPVVLHDAKLKRTTGLHKSIHSLTFEEVKKLDAGRWFDRRFAGEPIPSLEEVLETVGDKAGLMIEIKQGVLPPEYAVNAVFDVLEMARNPLPKLVIGGFSLDTAILTKRRADRCRDRIDIKTIGIAEHYGCIAPFLRHDVDIMAAWHRLLIPAVADELKVWTQSGVKEVWSFTVNDEKLAQDLIKAGVSGIITNYPHQIKFL